MLEHEIALSAVIKASRICQTVQQSLKQNQVISKCDLSPVTIADCASQIVINRALMTAFPSYGMIAEEDSRSFNQFDSDSKRRIMELTGIQSEEEIVKCLDWGNQSTECTWTLDPIDGTKGFLRNEQYAVCLALLREGVPVLGILACPNLLFEKDKKGALFLAKMNEGAYEAFLESQPTFRRINVSSHSVMSDAVVCESYESGHSSHSLSEKLKKHLGIHKTLRIDSQCKYALLARGQANIYVRFPSQGYEEKIWDHAAGSLLVKEAGGFVSDRNGKDLFFGLGSTLASNCGIVAAASQNMHSAVINALKSLS